VRRLRRRGSNGKDRPLGFYIFTNDEAARDKLLYATISGGVACEPSLSRMARTKILSIGDVADHEAAVQTGGQREEDSSAARETARQESR